jgi:hypothetical protein
VRGADATSVIVPELETVSLTTENNVRLLQWKEEPHHSEQQYPCPQHLYT